MTVLVTGFEPFDGGTLNPSGEVARRLDGRRIGGVPVSGRVLPVAFARLPAIAEALVAELRPVAVIGLGLSAGEPVLRLEQIAVNRAHSERPDNDGATPSNRPLDAAGPAARLATLALEPALDRLRARGLPARLSFHAGTHCCNLLLYHLTGVLERAGNPAPCGFVHLPCLPEQALATAVASMPLDAMVAGVELVAAAALDQAASTA